MLRPLLLAEKKLKINLIVQFENKSTQLQLMKVLISIHNKTIWILILSSALWCCFFLFLINYYTKEDDYWSTLYSYNLHFDCSN